MKVFSFRNFRIVILLVLLAFVAFYTQAQQLNTTSWFLPIEVTIFPINGDGDPKTDLYIQRLSVKHFREIDHFFARNAKRYHLITQQPIATILGKTINTHPPTPPEYGSTLAIMFWSLKLRYWAYQNTPDNKSNSHRIRLYVLYHQGKRGQALQHSLGLNKGLIGIIHAYATPQQTQQNAVIMTHEILHTVGATDKYSYQDNQPIYPQGYARPNKGMLYPQKYAEIMAGRIPLSPTRSKIPASLRRVIVGETTAKEVNWITTAE